MRRSHFAACLFRRFARPPPRIAGRHDHGPVPALNPFLGDSCLPGPGVGREMRDVRGKIDDAREGGLISGRQARRLRREARAIERLADVYGPTACRSRSGGSWTQGRSFAARPGERRAGERRATTAADHSSSSSWRTPGSHFLEMAHEDAELQLSLECGKR